jgi:hypothetical protein
MDYYYLVSSLPMISFAQADSMTMTLEKFTELCRENLTRKDWDIFEKTSLTGELDAKSSKVEKAFRIWDINLRNAILARRCSQQEAAICRQEEQEFFAEIEGLIQEAGSKSNPLEREIFLDELRVKKIDELTAQNRFDIEFLCAFKLKLILISKYRKLSIESGEENFNLLVDDIIKNSNLME